MNFESQSLRGPKIWTELYFLSLPILVLPNTSIHSSIRSKNQPDSILYLYYSGSVYLSDLSGFKRRVKEIFLDLMTANATKIFLKLTYKQFRHRVFNRHRLFSKRISLLAKWNRIWTEWIKMHGQTITWNFWC